MRGLILPEGFLATYAHEERSSRAESQYCECQLTQADISRCWHVLVQSDRCRARAPPAGYLHVRVSAGACFGFHRADAARWESLREISWNVFDDALKRADPASRGADDDVEIRPRILAVHEAGRRRETSQPVC